MKRHLEKELFCVIKKTLNDNLQVDLLRSIVEQDANNLVYLANKALVLMKVREIPKNSNDGHMVNLIQETVGGHSNEAWCVAQQMTCVAFAEQILNIKSSLYTTESCADLRAHSKGIPFGESKRGDLWIFKHDNGTGHIACFDAWIKKDVSARTLEGNTTKGLIGDKIVREGGGSYACERAISAPNMNLKMVVRAF